MNEDMHVLYRPQNFDELLGQDHISKSLLGFEESGKWPHAYLLTGPAGCGKTSTARIIADKLGALKNNITEIDAASHNSITDVRTLTEGLQYTGFGENPTKIIIIDECHALSKSAWQGLLKSIEEPPSHVYFILCTTDDHKVPKTIKTRCNAYTFRSVSVDDLCELIEAVCDDQGIKFEPKMVTLLAREAEGSPRESLTLLSVARGAENIEELRELLETASENKSVIELCRLLLKPNASSAWTKAIRLVKEMEDLPVETVRLTVLAYMTKVALGSKNPPVEALQVMDAFSGSWNETEKKAPLLLALGDALLGE